MARDDYDVYLDGDPNAESTRRHMERVLTGEPRRRWPWLLGLMAGGTAFAFWRFRRGRRAEGGPLGPMSRTRTVRS